MEFFRRGHDVWGQEVINGLSWDLLDVAVVVGVAVIVVHFVFRAITRKRG
jgi:lipoprotein signal peptidase